MAELALISLRQLQIQADSARGNHQAKLILKVLRDKTKYVAGTQIGITLCSIALGAIVEPVLSESISGVFSSLPKALVSFISICTVSYPLVVVGELVPKYLALRNPNGIAKALVVPLRFWVVAVQPLVWLFERSAAMVLLPFGIKVGSHDEETLSRSELQMVVQASEDAGDFDEEHADVVLKALRLDRLTAKDIMIHRLDMDCLQAELEGEALIEALRQIRHSRLPVYGADMDDILGVIYLQDVLRHWGGAAIDIKGLLRPAKFVPENLSLDRALSIMRETRTQILLVQDEYGGTKGMLTLEDIVEEILGDLQDGLEAERPEVEQITPTRLRLSPYVRWDQILDFLDEPIHENSSTDAIATMVTNELERIPVQGDSIETHLGRLVVEQITRSRIVQMGLYLNQTFPRPASPRDESED